MVDVAVGNSLSNMWSGLSFISQFVGTFLGVALVLGGFYMLIKRGR